MAQLTPKKYPWAQNPAKLDYAFKKLNDKARFDPTIEVTEETVKAEYVKMAGVVIHAPAHSSDADVPESSDGTPKAPKKSKSKVIEE